MGWIFAGFLTGLGIETFIRILSNYEPQVKEKTPRVNVSMPWYGWGLLGLLTYGVLRDKRKTKRRKEVN